jgi:hypothetical protein
MLCFVSHFTLVNDVCFGLFIAVFCSRVKVCFCKLVIVVSCLVVSQQNIICHVLSFIYYALLYCIV